MMYIHDNNETDKTINVSKIANTSTLLYRLNKSGHINGGTGRHRRSCTN